MLKSIRRILVLSGRHSWRLKLAFILALLEAMVIKGPLLLFVYALYLITTRGIEGQDILFISAYMVGSLGIRMAFRHGIHVFQSGTGYNMMTDERMKLGNRIRRLPMGFFSEGNIGRISSVITTDMVFLEEAAMDKFTVIISSYLNLLMSAIILFIFDVRIGLVVSVVIGSCILFLNKILRNSDKIAPRRQKVIEDFVQSIIEYVRGLAVTKAFNLSGKKSKALNESFKSFRDIMIEFEKMLTPLLLWHEIIIGIAIGGLIFLSGYYSINQTMPIYMSLMIILLSFELFAPLMTLSRTIPMIRIVEAGLDRYEKINDVALIDATATEKVIHQFGITFDDVTFAYEKSAVIKNMSFQIEEGTMTALVGQSGCGKTTIANLIARFWDVDKGSVKIGGVNIKEVTCDSLLQHISMVFQRVYLFNDTILNNILFAKPDASMDEIQVVCKKARCHDFIMQLENGYDTMVGEGGCTLSGGEKQRLSIARAMLKDAPIILLDEATASIDPDNELYIKEAINELVKDKTLVVIAHNLSTIKEADQILVIEDGQVVQRGIHETLIEEEGYYKKFWQRRQLAKGWTL